MPSIDKALLNGENLGLTASGDFSTVEDKLAILQAAELRCLSEFESWLYDENFGSSLGSHIREKGTYTLTDSVAATYINAALRPMLEDGRVDEVRSVKVLSRTDTSVFIELVLVLGTQVGTISYEVKNFIT